MKKLGMFVVMLTMVVAGAVPASATSWAYYGSCADIPTYAEAQQILDDPS